MTIQPQGSDKVEWARYTTEDIGYFGFDTKDYYGPAELRMLVQHETDPGVYEPERKARIKLERALTPTPRMLTEAEKRIDGAHISSGHNQVEQILDNTSMLIDADGIVLPEVTIREKRRYIDYFTFHAFDVKKDVELELDLGEYPTDVLGYLLDKGYSGYYDPDAATGASGSMSAMSGDFFLDGIPVFWYIHDDTKCLYQGEYEQPWLLDTRDLEGILVFDSPANTIEIRESVPLYMKLINAHNDMDAIIAMNGGLSTDKLIRYRLVDIHVKNESDILSNKAKRNLGQRVGILDGFTIQTAQFYSPVYPEGPVPGDVDYRRTLYWNPNVVTDSLGHAEIEFYNNSYSTRFNVNGAGITRSGTPYNLDIDF